MPVCVKVEFASEAPNPLNSRECWQARARRVRRQRAETRAALRAVRPPPGPWEATVTRRGARRLDLDGLLASTKSHVDELAAWLGCTDAPGGPLRVLYRGATTSERVRVPIKRGRSVIGSKLAVRTTIRLEIRSVGEQSPDGRGD